MPPSRKHYYTVLLDRTLGAPFFAREMGLGRPLRKRAVAHFYAVGESLQLETHPTWIYIRRELCRTCCFSALCMI